MPAREILFPGSARDLRAGFGDPPKQSFTTWRARRKVRSAGRLASTRVACAPQP